MLFVKLIYRLKSIHKYVYYSNDSDEHIVKFYVILFKSILKKKMQHVSDIILISNY